MKITFNITFHTVWGQKICIIGSIPELGGWSMALSKEMHYMGGGNWSLDVQVPDNTRSVQYRYFLNVNETQSFEEWETPHEISLDPSVRHYTLYDVWQAYPENKAFYSSAFTKSLFAHPVNTFGNATCSNRKLVIRVSAPRIEMNQCLAITGNQDYVGNWDPSKALMLSCHNFPEWYIELDANQIKYPFEYKFIVLDAKTHHIICWEKDDNRLLCLIPQEEGETVIVSGLYFRDNLPLWRCAGTVIPVFSLRSEHSFGVGDLGDLRLLVDWAKKTHQRIIQVLPMNDTTITHTWVDSYPYSAISIYALHPMFINLTELGKLKDAKRSKFYEAKRKELNAKEAVDYEAVNTYKLSYCREYFQQDSDNLLNSSDFKTFFAQNKEWLLPYAAYCYLRDKFGTSDFSQWKQDSVYDKERIANLCSPKNENWKEISFFFFLQFVLDRQFRAVADYARRNGIVLKGDLAIGVNRRSIEVWTEPEYFNLNGQAGAPPDDFSINGQNWLFPTYNWEAMEESNYDWWKRRFHQLEKYFDCLRIDHVLGFFRIWEVPLDFVQGLCGHFNPALPFTVDEIQQYGLSFNEARFTNAHINRRFLPQLFGDLTEKVTNTYLVQSSSHHFILKPFCDTQRKIEKLFEGKNDTESQRIKAGLFAIANEVLFLRDPKEPEKFHPRISAFRSFIYSELSDRERSAFDQLYWNFFYHRHNDFWKSKAFKHLTPLVNCTQMLLCGEDLGMNPASVPEVMHKLQIFSLEIERMPKTDNREFSDMYHLPYHSVCTTSTHDMPPLRNWWQENRDQTQRYYNNVLQRIGAAPIECSSDIAAQIISNHLRVTSMLTIIPLQDWLAMDDHLKRKDIEAERINVPAQTNFYWRYRMHITLETLLKEDSLNEKIRNMIADADRH